MKANPGGQLAASEIIGRDELIARVWQILETKSVYINDLRRIGKTQLFEKMIANPCAGWIAVKQDLEGCHSADEFAAQVYRHASQALRGKETLKRGLDSMLAMFKGVEIGGVLRLPESNDAVHWKMVLQKSFDAIQASIAGSDIKVVFLWDEVPFMLDNIAKRQGNDVAMQIFDMLRALSQSYANIRMILTGSIGLHHVLEQLHLDGYHGSPLNHLRRVRVGPLTPEFGAELAKLLLVGIGWPKENIESCAKHLCSAVGNVPHYIHLIAHHLYDTDTYDEATIARTVRNVLLNHSDELDLPHYQNRLRKYYKPADLAFIVLDAIAVAGTLAFEEIFDQICMRQAFDENDKELLRSLLKRLSDDHYLERDEESSDYRFYLPLIRRWWCMSRNLAEPT